jgi:hypothetical protein
MTGMTQGTPVPVAQLPEQFATTVPGLQAQIADLQVQLSGLQAQWKGMQTQLNQMLRSNPARPGLQQQWTDVGVQMARVEGDIARLQAQLALKQGTPIRTPGIPGFAQNGGVDPNVVIPAVTVLTMVLLLPVSIAWARRILRRAPKPAPVSTDHTMRLERIEQAVDTIAIEVERISEGQRFVTKLLAQRGTSIVSPVSPGGSSNEAKQPLALGAGAMEPIVAAERERARERVVTPH